MNTCLDWKSGEVVELAKQVGVESTPAFADKVGVLMEQLGLDENIIVSEENIDKINDDIDKLNNRIILLEGQLNLYEAGSEQYNDINVDLDKTKSNLSALENKLNQPQLPTVEQVKEYLEKNQPAKSVTTTIKPGVSELFESNPELASIGTQEQYSQYLDTIFPDYINNFAYEAVEEFLVSNKIIDRKC